jgi:stress-induced-phosphoprotein 1
LKNYDAALEDGNKCVSIKADWDKGHQRKAMALHGLKRYQEAMAAYDEGLKINP